MSKASSVLKVLLFCSIATSALFCTLPTDPSKDPNKLQATFSLLDSSRVVTQGVEAIFCLTINYPVHVNTIKISFGEEGISDTTLKCTTASTTPEVLLFKCCYKTTKAKTITATVYLSVGLLKEFRTTVVVAPKEHSVTFLSTPEPHLAALNQPDTSYFIASTSSGSKSFIFNVSTSPELDDNHRSIVTRNDTAIVIITPLQSTTYTARCTARFGDVFETADVSIGTYSLPVLASASAHDTTTLGIADTLFLIASFLSDPAYSISMLDSSDPGNGIISVLSTGPDTMSMLFSPIESKTYALSFQVKKDSLVDTFTLRRTARASLLGPVITLKNGAAPGSRLQVATGVLVAEISDPDGISSVTATINGTKITDITSSGDDYTIPYSLAQFGTNVIVIKGKDNSPDSNGNSLTLSYTYNTSPTAITVTGPFDGAQEIAVQPTFTWSGGNDADEDEVFFKVLYGEDTTLAQSSEEFLKVQQVSLTAALSVHTKYYWRLIGYTKGAFQDTVKTSIFSMTTINPDRTTPILTLVATLSYRANMRVTSAGGSISLTATDDNGIDSVYYTINGSSKTAISGAGPTYSFTYTLPVTGTNTINVYALDASAERNKDSLVIAFDYNTEPSAVTLSDPRDNSTGIEVLPTFTWSGGEDPDNDPVSYRVLYGTTKTSLTSQSPAINAPVKTYTLTTELTAGKTYYWKVVAFTGGRYDDTVSSEVRSFTTSNPDQTVPSLTITTPATYTPGMRVTSATGTIAFTATDENGIDSAYYVVNGGTLNMVTGSSGNYSFQYTLDRRKLDTITVSVVDASSQHNKTSTPIIVNYNSKLPTAINPVTPAANATDIPILASFAWKALSDDDKDLIYYKVEYSTSSDLSPSVLSEEVSTPSLNLGPDDILSKSKCYYYRIIGYTKSPFRDTAVSQIQKFYTEKEFWTIADNTLTDPDGNTYTTVTIGTQVWTVENLMTTKFNDGSSIPLVTDSTVWESLEEPAHCWYNNSTNTADRQKWGALYNWYTIETKKLAPTGWHVPTEDDWEIMRSYLIENGYNWNGSKTGNMAAKAVASKTGWKICEITGTVGCDPTKNNKSGFSGLPGGYRYEGEFKGLNESTFWWTSSPLGASNAWSFRIAYNDDFFYCNGYLTRGGLSVRLIRD